MRFIRRIPIACMLLELLIVLVVVFVLRAIVRILLWLPLDFAYDVVIDSSARMAERLEEA